MRFYTLFILATTISAAMALGASARNNTSSPPRHAMEGNAQSLYERGVSLIQSSNGSEAEAFSLIEAAAKKGHAPSIRELGKCYLYGIGCEKDTKKAWELLQKAVARKDASALYYIAKMYDNGWYVPEDNTKYIVTLKDAAAMKAPEALAELGGCYLFGSRHAIIKQDQALGVRMVEEAALKSEPFALLCMGYAHEQGLGGKQKHDATALRYFSQAAEKGNVQAHTEVARCYLGGIGTEKDYDLAMEHLEQAQAKGNAHAVCLIADIYKNGYGVEPNLPKAIELYRKAAREGYATAYARLGWMYFSGEGVDRNARYAFRCFNDAANSGSDEGYGGLGICYEYGIGTQPNITKALGCYNSAARRGESFASYRLYTIYRNGTDGVAPDHALALENLQRAYAGDYDYAVYSLGKEQILGEIIEKDKNAGLNLIISAADSGNPVACAMLGIMYYEGGDVVKRDFDKAFSYLQAASEHPDDIENEDLVKVYNNLSKCYRFGRGTTADEDKAQHFTQCATRLGDENMAKVMKFMFD